MKSIGLRIKQFLIGSAILIVIGFSIGYFAGWRLESQRTFAGFPGIYDCENFGIPDTDHSRLKITSDLKVIGISSDEEVSIGPLFPTDETNARLNVRLDLDSSNRETENVQTTYYFEGKGQLLLIRERKEKQDAPGGLVSCQRVG